MIMSEFRDKIRILRDEYALEDRRNAFNEFGLMKKQLISEFFDHDPFYTPSSSIHRVDEHNLGTGPEHMQKRSKRMEHHDAQNDKQNVSKGSLENLYEKIKDLKSEFQHVEEKMRSAVESLPNKGRTSSTSIPGNRDPDGETMSSRSWRKKDELGDRLLKPSSSDYYPGKFTDKLRARSPELLNGSTGSFSSVYSSNPSEPGSRVASPTYPFLSSTGSSVSSPSSTSARIPPVRGAKVTNLPFPEYGSAVSPISEKQSNVSTPTYPFARSPCDSPEPGSSIASSTNTLRPYSPNSLAHSETYVQIPVQRGKTGREVEVGRWPLPSWEIRWMKQNDRSSLTGLEEEKIGYEATVYEYLEI